MPAVAGIVLALPSVWLVSRNDGEHGSAGVADALIAGMGFAVQFLAMARVPADAGFWPIAVSRAVSVCAIVPLVLLSSATLRLSRPTVAKAAAAGALGTVAILLYWYATHQQLVAVATVLTALYPAIPVVLAMVFLRERATRTQVTGLIGAGAAVGLIALG